MKTSSLLKMSVSSSLAGDALIYFDPVEPVTKHDEGFFPFGSLAKLQDGFGMSREVSMTAMMLVEWRLEPLTMIAGSKHAGRSSPGLSLLTTAIIIAGSTGVVVFKITPISIVISH
jgi:hypothetical protein